ncbi:MAG: TIGR03936 family radical SAM-associated protein [Raoultibacter sp.]
MADQQNFRLRVFFAKSGRCAMLSHLEVARALERAVRRAALPYAISQGFSPHMKIAFGAALPVGVGGVSECFDLMMTSYIAPERVEAALRESSVPDLMVHRCTYIGPKDPAASAAYPLCTYEALLSSVPLSLQLPESITVIRKKKERELVVADFLVGDMKAAGATLTFTLRSCITGSLRADVLLAEVLKVNPGIALKTLTRISQKAESL